MAAEAEEQQTLIHEVRNKKVASQKDGPSGVRIARFLKPCADNFDEGVRIPNTPMLFEIFPHDLQDWPSKVIFKGWNSPQKKWKEWVESLAEKYGAIWKHTGICDAIMSSIYEVRFDSDLLLGLTEFWCCETNTFMFPWGEATVTLEDMMILGGFPVVGEEIRVPLSEELVRFVEEMNKRRTEMCRSRAKKAAHGSWIKHFMEEERESEFEHVGFLSLWLSRFVFPSLAEEVIGKHVFPIAAALSQGKPVAIAPAVLGSLYKDLRLLKEKGMDFEESISVSSPFQLLQLWALEHFPLFGSTPNLLNSSEPRIARWNTLNLNINLPLVRSALQLAENYKWRPYAADLENWRHPSYYKETEQSLLSSSNLDMELRSFFQCLKASELVGVDGSKEKYLPNRVAMQFGMDQDIPADVSGLNIHGENVRFFVPPRSFEPGVSGRYMRWWKGMMLNRKGAIEEEVVEKRNDMMCKASLSIKENGPVASRSPVTSVEVKKSTNGSNISIASKVLQGLGKLSTVSMKSDIKQKRELDSADVPSVIQICSDSSDDDHVSIGTLYKNNGDGSPAMKSKVSSSSQVKKSEVSMGYTLDTALKSEVLSPVSTKAHITWNCETNSPDIPCGIKDQIPSDSSGNDHIPISTSVELRCSVAKSTNSTNFSFNELTSPTNPLIKRDPESKSSNIPCGIKEKMPHDSSDDDHIPISTSVKLRCSVAKSTGSLHQGLSCNQSHNAVSSTSSIGKESTKKRKLHATTETISQEEVTEKSTEGVAKEVKIEVGCCLNEQIDTDEVTGEIKMHEKGGESPTAVPEGEKLMKAGESLGGNPIEIDNQMHQNLLWRVEKLERLVKVLQDSKLRRKN